MNKVINFEKMCNQLFSINKNYFIYKTGYMQKKSGIEGIKLLKSQIVYICQ